MWIDKTRFWWDSESNPKKRWKINENSEKKTLIRFSNNRKFLIIFFVENLKTIQNFLIKTSKISRIAPPPIGNRGFGGFPPKEGSTILLTLQIEILTEWSKFCSFAEYYLDYVEGKAIGLNYWEIGCIILYWDFSICWKNVTICDIPKNVPIWKKRDNILSDCAAKCGNSHF